MNNLELLPIITAVAASIVGTALSTFILIRLINKRNEKIRTDNELYSNFMRERVEIEYKIRNLEDQLIDTVEKYNEINHLLIRSQENSAWNKNEDFPTKKMKLTPYMQKIIGTTNDYEEIDENFIFYLTPFNSTYLEEYKKLKELCSLYRLTLLRGDEEPVDDILAHILKNIIKARLIIANVSGRNPNVYYELGIAHSLNKPVILVSRGFSNSINSENKNEFDNIQSKRIIFYRSSNDLVDKVKDELLKVFILK